MESAPHSFTAITFGGMHGAEREGLIKLPYINLFLLHVTNKSHLLSVHEDHFSKQILTCLSHRPQCTRTGTFIIKSRDEDGQVLSTLDALYSTAVWLWAAVVVAVVVAVASPVAVSLHSVAQCPLCQVPLVQQNVWIAVSRHLQVLGNARCCGKDRVIIFYCMVSMEIVAQFPCTPVDHKATALLVFHILVDWTHMIKVTISK